METEIKEVRCNGCRKKLTIIKMAERDFLEEYYCAKCKMINGDNYGNIGI